MMRILIPFVAALGLSLGITTGVVMMRAPARPAVTQKGDNAKVATVAGDSAKKSSSAHSDSTHTDSTRADSTHAVATRTDSIKVDTAHMASHAASHVVSHMASTEARNGTASEKSPSVAASSATVPVKSVALPSKSVPTQNDSVEKRLAKVFAAMQARDASHILQQMEDADVRVILASLSAKQQAAILGQFPAQRAATLTRATLRGREDEGDQ